MISDLEPGRLATVLLVLRYLAQGHELEHAVSLTDAGVTGNHRVRPDDRSRPDLDMLPDDRIGADLDIGGELGTRMDDGGGVNHMA